MNLIPTFSCPAAPSAGSSSKDNLMQSHSKAGRPLLLILLALGVASGCGDSTLPEATDTSAPELETLSQANIVDDALEGIDDFLDFTMFGGWAGRPTTHGACNYDETKAGFATIDSQWDKQRRAMMNYTACNALNGPPDGREQAFLLGHVWKGGQCLAGQGTSSTQEGCNEWNNYMGDRQATLRRRMESLAKQGQSLSPARIFNESMAACGNSIPCALWIAYRVTNGMSGSTETSRDGKVLDAMPNMRSACSDLREAKDRGGIYYHFFLVALITYTNNIISTVPTLERYASYGSARGDSDKAGANWEGMKLGYNLFWAQGQGLFGQCINANPDSTKVIIGESKNVQLAANDSVTPFGLIDKLAGFVMDKSSELSVFMEQGVNARVESIGPPGKREFWYSLGLGDRRSRSAVVTVDVQCAPNLPDWDPATSQCTNRCNDCEGDQYCNTASGAPTCECSPENPDWNSATKACEPPLSCGDGTSASGGDEGYSKTLEMGATSGTLSVSYNTYTQKDRIRIMYGGATLLDTGCVGESKTIAVPYSGTSTQATVLVEPNCEGGSGTVWDFSFGCAR